MHPVARACVRSSARSGPSGSPTRRSSSATRIALRRFTCRCCPAGRRPLRVLHLSRPAPDARPAPQGRVGRAPWPTCEPDLVVNTGDNIVAPGRRPGRAGRALEPLLRACPACSSSGRTTTSSPSRRTRSATCCRHRRAGAGAVAAAADRGPRHGAARRRLDRPDQHARDARRCAGRALEFVGVDDPHLRATTATAWSRGRSSPDGGPDAWASRTRPTSASSTP